MTVASCTTAVGDLAADSHGAKAPRLHDIKTLTSLRGLAAMWVFIYHLSGSFPAAIPSFLWFFVRRGGLAVDIFFVLSGFVLAFTYTESFKPRFTLNAYARFLVKRAGRIMPLNAVMVLVILSGISLITLLNLPYAGIFPHYSFTTVIQNLLLIEVWGLSGISIDPPAWSISIEMANYVAFPLLLWVSLNRFWPAALVLSIVIVLVDQRGLGVASATILETGMAEFLLGILAFRAYAIGAFSKSAPLYAALISILTVACILWHASVLPAILLFPPLVLLLARERGWMVWIGNCPPLYYLGEISYSIYLLHWGVIAVIHRSLSLGDVASACIVIAIVLGTSALTYRLIEKPARNLVRTYAEMAIAHLSK